MVLCQFGMSSNTFVSPNLMAQKDVSGKIAYSELMVVDREENGYVGSNNNKHESSSVGVFREDGVNAVQRLSDSSTTVE